MEHDPAANSAADDHEVDAREFLQSAEFRPERVTTRYPDAEQVLLGGLFVSHSGLDADRFRAEIFAPVIVERFPADTAFFHNRQSGGADDYRELVQAALRWCDKFMIVVSRQSIRNEWVLAEVEWALTNLRPIVVARLDQTTWETFLDAVRPNAASDTGEPFANVDLSQTTGLEPLALVLDEMKRRWPIRGRFAGW